MCRAFTTEGVGRPREELRLAVTAESQSLAPNFHYGTNVRVKFPLPLGNRQENELCIEYQKFLKAEGESELLEKSDHMIQNYWDPNTLGIPGKEKAF